MKPTGRVALAWLCAAVVVSGCGGIGLSDTFKGLSEAELVTVKGPPTGRYMLPHGMQRLEFARGPQGRQTFMADVDSRGRVTRFEQVLDVRRFALVTPGATRGVSAVSTSPTSRPAARMRSSSAAERQTITGLLLPVHHRWQHCRPLPPDPHRRGPWTVRR